MIRFTIPYPPTKKGKSAFCGRFGLNAYYECRKSWQARRRDADEFHALALVSMKKAGIRRQLLKYPVTVAFYWNDGLDADNHAVMGKFIVDAMVGYILPDDGRRWLRRVSHEFWEGDEILVEVRRYGQRDENAHTPLPVHRHRRS